MSSPRMTVSPRMVLIVAATTSRARPPENTNLIYGLWFDRLHQPATGLPCCSISDCRLTESRVVGSRYEALVEGKWLAVPPETVVEVRTIQQDAPLCVGYRGRGFLAL